MSGIVAIANIETVACQAREKVLQIRNNDNEQPQRVQGVLFELGTNEKRYFKILDVTVGNKVKAAVGNQVDEVILPPGGAMQVRVSYNPKEVTTGEDDHVTYLDVFLNGPKMGIMQVEIRGTAPQAVEGCSPGESGVFRSFQVTGVKAILSHQDLGESVETELNVATDVQGEFALSGSEGEATLTPEGWPTIVFPLPETDPPPPLSSLNILLDEEVGPVDFSSGDLVFENAVLSAPGVGVFSGLTLTTGSITITSAEAPKVFGGTITLTGSPLNDSGEMKLVVAAALVNPPVNTVASVGEGVFGLEITLQEIP